MSPRDSTELESCSLFYNAGGLLARGWVVVDPKFQIFPARMRLRLCSSFTQGLWYCQLLTQSLFLPSPWVNDHNFCWSCTALLDRIKKVLQIKCWAPHSIFTQHQQFPSSRSHTSIGGFVRWKQTWLYFLFLVTNQGHPYRLDINPKLGFTSSQNCIYRSWVV